MLKIDSKRNDFFKALFKKFSGYIEIRTIDTNYPVTSYWIPTTNMMKINSTLKNIDSKKTNVYFGVCPRNVKEGKEINVNQLNCLWVDIDCKNEEEKNIKREEISNFSKSPSAVINSGHGLHCYWILDEPYSFKEEERLDIKRIIKGLSMALGGDTKAHDLSRLLRVPGTYNIKNPDTPLEVKFEVFQPDTTYYLEDFEKYYIKDLQDVEIEKIEIHEVEISQRFYKMIEKNKELRDTWEGNRPDLEDKSRSGYDMALVHQLLNKGFDESEIYAVLGEYRYGKYNDGNSQYKRITIGKASASYKNNNNKRYELVNSLASCTTTAKQLLKKELPKREYIISEGILPQNGYLLLAGEAKEGKTTFALQMALNLVLGISFIDEFEIKFRERVLYLFAENTEYGLKKIMSKQVEGLSEYTGIDDENLDNLILASSKDLILDTKPGIDKLNELLRYYVPDVVMIDPLALFASRDLNKLENATRLIKNMNSVLDRNSCAAVLIHHFRKPSKNDTYNSIHRVIGSSGFGNYCESFLGLERYHPQRSANYKRLNFKLRSEQAPEPMILLKDPNSLLYSVIEDTDVESSCTKVSNIIEILKNDLGGKATYSQIVKVGMNKLGVSKTRIQDLLIKAKELGKVGKEEGKRGKYFIIDSCSV